MSTEAEAQEDGIWPPMERWEYDGSVLPVVAAEGFDDLNGKIRLELWHIDFDEVPV